MSVPTKLRRPGSDPSSTHLRTTLVAAAPVQARRPHSSGASSARMTTPLLPDDYLHMVNPLWSARELRGKDH